MLSYHQTQANMKELVKLLALLGSLHYTVLLTTAATQVIETPVLWRKKTKQSKTKQLTQNSTTNAPKPAMTEEHKKRTGIERSTKLRCVLSVTVVSE